MGENSRRISWDRWARWTLRHPKKILVVTGLLSLFFALGLLKAQIDTQMHDFHAIHLRELIETVEADFDEGNYLALIFESQDGRSLLEPARLREQARILSAIRKEYSVETLGLIDAVEEGLRRAKKKTLAEVEDFTPIAEGLMALSGSKTIRDLEKLTRHLLSDPEGIAYYSKLRVAGGLGAGLGGGLPGGSLDSIYSVPKMVAIKAYVQLDAKASKAENKRTMVKIRDLATRLSTPEIKVYALADDLITAEIDSRTVENLLLMGGIVFLTVGAVFWALFRRKNEVLVPFILMLLSLVWSFGIASWLGMRLSFLHLLVLPILFGTADDDAFIFAVTLDEERPGASSLAEALRRATVRTGSAIFLTTFSTFVSFFFGAFPMTSPGIFSFNIVVSLSMLIAFLLSVTLQGPLRWWLKDPLNPPRSLRPSRVFSAIEVAAGKISEISLWALRFEPRKVVAISGGVLILGAVLAFWMPSEFSRRIFLRPAMPTYQAEVANERYFGRSDHGYILFEGPVAQAEFLGILAGIVADLDRYPLAEKVLGKTNTDSLPELLQKFGVNESPDWNQTLEELRSSDRTANFPRNQTFADAAKRLLHRGEKGFDATAIKFYATGGDGSKIRAFVEALDRSIADLKLKERFGIDHRIGAGDLNYHLGEAFYFHNFIQSFALSLGFNFLALFLVWRRWKDCFLALVPVFFSLALTLGTMGVFGIALNALNICIGSIVVGVGVDYSIHLIDRFRELRREGGGDYDAMRKVLEALGPGIVGGALTTIIGFAACSVLAMPVAASFGLLLALAIFFAFVSSMVGLPSLMLIFFRREKPRGI